VRNAVLVHFLFHELERLFSVDSLTDKLTIDSEIQFVNCVQGRNEGDKGGTIPQAPDHYGDPESLRGR